MENAWNNLGQLNWTLPLLHLKTLIVGQIMGPIVARMFFGGYWSNLPEGHLNIQEGDHFFKMAAIFTIQNYFLNKMHLFGGFQWS